MSCESVGAGGYKRPSPREAGRRRQSGLEFMLPGLLFWEQSRSKSGGQNTRAGLSQRCWQIEQAVCYPHTILT
jgi:hypothetical protein